MNRTIAPEFHSIEKLEFQHAESHTLNNGIPVFSVNAGSQELCRIDFVFKAGMYYQSAPLIAAAANNLMETGTLSRTANDIIEGIDFYGSFFEYSVGQDYAMFSLYALNKYLEPTLEIVEDVFRHASYPEDEFKIYIANKKQKYLINSQKVNVIARRKFTEILFGEKHPYGIDVTEQDHDKLKLDDVKQFYNTHYSSANLTIIAAGNLPNHFFTILNKHFGNKPWGNKSQIQKESIPASGNKSKKHFIEKPEAIQSAIRVGRILFNKTHPDFFKFQILNTILGGYFGSRLMSNIREDKGYTYGIGSGVTSLVHNGYFFISTEVGAEVTQNALDEIYNEIARLREELVPDGELETVRNYILGQFLRSIDGPFALADKFKNIWEFGLDYNYYTNYFNAIKSVSPEELRNLANLYLKQEDLTELVVGKK